MALALKYRPKLFRDLVGQESVSQTLSLALDSQKIGNAYLFSGLRGSGKTSSARIFARALQCDKGISSLPCGECANCRASLEGRHIDIIEMDAASNRRIDDIRDLIEQTRYNPSMGRYKIFIIDEVHMLTKEAFNALLKTLEEPPERVKFILATTDPLLVPATILSRTQHFRFKKIPHKLVVNHIQNILQQEGIEYETEALEVIARSGEGSLRDTLTLLDQAILYGGNRVNAQETITMLGIINPEILENFFFLIMQRDESGIEKILDVMREYECEMIVDEMMIFLKDKALSHSSNYPPILLNRFFSILVQAKNLLALNSNSEFVLLLCVMKMKEALKLKDVSSYIQELEKRVEDKKIDLHCSNPVNTSKIDSNHLDEDSNLKNESKIEVCEEKNKFDLLKSSLYDRSYLLGELFEKNFHFISYSQNNLVLRSYAVGDEREELAKHWKIIKELVGKCFGEGVNLVFQTPKTSAPTEECRNIKEENETSSIHLQSKDQSQEDNQSLQTSCKEDEALEVQNQMEQNSTQSILQRNHELFSTLERHLGVNLADVKIVKND